MLAAIGAFAMIATALVVQRVAMTADRADAADGTAHKNVLFITIDDSNDWFGYLGGHPQVLTPNIDALAAQSTVFTNASADSPWCNPSRTSMALGLRPASTGILSNDPFEVAWRDLFSNATSTAFANYGPGIEDIRTLYGHFNDNEYDVSLLGKMHHSHAQTLTERRDYGSADLVDGYPALHPVTPENAPLSGLDNLYLATNNDWGAIEDIEVDGASGAFTELDTRDHRLTDAAVAALEETSANSPFFLGVGFYLPHNPLYPPQRFLDLYDEDLTGEPLVLPDVLIGDLADTIHPGGTSSQLWASDVFSDPDEWRSLVQAYLASISFVDEKVGEVIDSLDATGLREDTIVVLWSDHGYHLGEKEGHGKKTMWRESINVPLLVSSAGHAAATVPAPINSVDLMPTLVDLTGLSMPTDFPRDGRSLSPLMTEASSPWPWEGSAQVRRPGGTLKIESAVFDEAWWFIKANSGELAYAETRHELYEMGSDPNQWTNLLAGQPWSSDIENTRRQLLTKTEGLLGPNRRPILNDQTVHVDRTEVPILLEANDSNYDDILFTVTQLPVSGTLHRTAIGGGLGSPITQADSIVETRPSGQVARLLYVPDDLAGFVDNHFEVRVSDGIEETYASVVLSALEPPAVAIDRAALGESFAAGETLTLSAVGTDDGPLPTSSYAWQVSVIDNGSIVPLGEPFGGSDALFALPDDGNVSLPHLRLDVTVVVTDSSGLVSVDRIELAP